MITFKAKDFDYSGTKDRVEGECLSTDTKPTTGIANGSCLIEMDTGDTYAFDETGAGTWRKLSSSGGGGSSLPAVTSDDNGDVLTVVNGAWDKASPSGGGGNFVVTFTENEGTFTADKTFAQITTAFSSGLNVLGMYLTMLLNLITVDAENAVDFCGIFPISGEGVVEGINIYHFIIAQNGDITASIGETIFGS